jgi:RNA polymerase sigma-70 factor (ECF subfamily)
MPQQRGLIREPNAWLTRVISRVCLDQLGSAPRAAREAPGESGCLSLLLGTLSGPPGSRLSLTSDPADVVTLDESASIALLVAMEQLTQPERVSLNLHDVFHVPFGEIAEIVGRTPDACRQLASSARWSIHAQRRFDVPSLERDKVVGAFRVASYLIGVLGREQQGRGPLSVAIEPVNGRRGIVARTAGTIVGVVDLAVMDGHVAVMDGHVAEITLC